MRSAACWCRAYPRWCGEHQAILEDNAWKHGLPPLVRGAPGCRASARTAARPTPAGAGSTRSAERQRTAPRAYPRWCGEHYPCWELCVEESSLPPLVRGALEQQDPLAALNRPTPAGAGSTWCGTASARVPSAYPRWCGEHRVSLATLPRWAGLPPLVRGAPGCRCRRRRRRGPTPAGAGSTGCSSPRSPSSAAYPRWCGEHGKIVIEDDGRLGLPPLVRGAHRQGRRIRRLRRPTPAGAGSTACPRTA